MSGSPSYLLANAGAEAPARLAALSAMFDAGTIRHLIDRGVGPGWHCLEIGGGNGSIARWLADRVGSSGRVVVTDIDPCFLESGPYPNLDVRRHDIALDDLPPRAFDLIHARLVLNHVAQWPAVFEKIFTALKPGGWFVDEEFDSDSLSPDGRISPGEVVLETHAATARLMMDRGFDRLFGRRLFARLRAHGFVRVGAEGRLFMLESGSPGAALLEANYLQLRGALADGGYVTAPTIDRDIARLNDPEFLMPSSIMWTAWGQRAEAAANRCSDSRSARRLS